MLEVIIYTQSTSTASKFGEGASEANLSVTLYFLNILSIVFRQIDVVGFGATFDRWL
jgi:hypothetical protein